MISKEVFDALNRARNILENIVELHDDSMPLKFEAMRALAGIGSLVCLLAAENEEVSIADARRANIRDETVGTPWD